MDINTNILILSVIGIAIQHSGTAYLFVKTLDLKFNRFLTVFIYVLIMSAIESILLIATQDCFFRWGNPVMAICMFAFCCFAAKNNIFYKVGIFTSFMIAISLMGVLSDVLIEILVGEVDIVSYSLPATIFLTAGFYWFQVLIYPYLFPRMLTDFSLKKSNKVLFPAKYFQVVFLVVETFVVFYDFEIFKEYFIPTMICLFVYQNVVIYIGSQQVARGEVLEERYNNLEEQRNREYNYIMQQVERDAKYREFNHDMRNNLMTVHAMMSLEGNTKGLTMLNGILDEAVALESKRYSGNVAVDALFSFKEKTAEENDIDIDINLDVPADLNIRDIDLINILSNLVDNSIEACMNDQVHKQKWIHCKCVTKSNMFIIIISNSFQPPKHDKNLPKRKVKKWTDESGLGTRIIDDLVKKYDGTTEIKEDGEVYEVTVILPLN